MTKDKKTTKRSFFFRLLRKTPRFVIGTLLLLVLFFIAIAGGFDLYCEVQGLPMWAREMLHAKLSQEGVNVSFGQIRAGLLTAITVEDLNLQMQRQNLLLNLQSDRVKMQLKIPELFRSRVVLHSLHFDGGTLHLARQQKKGKDSFPSIVDLSCDIRRRPGNMYSYTLRGLGEGVSLKFNGSMHNAHALLSRKDQQEKPISNDEESLEKNLERLALVLRTCRFGSRDAVLEANIEQDARDLKAFSANGRWNVSDIVYRGMLVQTFKGEFRAGPKQIVLHDVLARVGQDEHFFGKIVLEPAKKRFWANIEGQMTPYSLIQMLGVREPYWYQRLKITAPFSFDAKILPSNWEEIDKWELQATCEAKGFAVQDLPVRSLKVKATISESQIQLADFNCQLGTSQSKEYIRGEAMIWPREKRFSVTSTSSCCWIRRLPQLGFPVPEKLRFLRFENNPPEMRLNLEKSPFDWKLWKGTGKLLSDEFLLSGHPLNAVRIDVSFADGAVEIPRFTCRLPDDTAVTAKAKCNFLKMAENQLPLTLNLQVGQTAKERIAELRGEFAIRPNDGCLSGKLDGFVIPGASYLLGQKAFGLPTSSTGDLLRDSRWPVNVDIEIPDTALDFSDWQIQTKFTAEKGFYGSAEIEDASGSFILDGTGISFDALSGTTRNPTAKIFLKLSAHHSPYRLRITEGKLSGDPLALTPFLGSQETQRIFDMVWQDFSWDPKTLAEINVSELRFDAPSTQSQGNLQINGRLQARNARFRTMPMKKLDLQLTLQQPGAITLKNVQIETGDAALLGELTIDLNDRGNCQFRVKETEGGCNPRDLVCVINPEWDSLLSAFEFSPKTTFDCDGSFFLADNPRLQLSGSFAAPFLKMKHAQIYDVAGTWGVDSSTVVSWDIDKATYAEGKLLTTGTYDLNQRSGLLAIDLSNASLQKLSEELSHKKMKKEIKASVGASCELRFMRNWAGKPIQLSGSGRTAIQGDELWNVPVLSQLGKLIDVPFLQKLSKKKTGGLGTITKLGADLSFSGERIIVPRLATDGTVISLSGEGEYSWGDDRLVFDIAGETFKNVGFFTVISRPLSWVFRARLSGTLHDNQWRMDNAIKRAIFGDDRGGIKDIGTP